MAAAGWEAAKVDRRHAFLVFRVAFSERFPFLVKLARATQKPCAILGYVSVPPSAPTKIQKHRRSPEVKASPPTDVTVNQKSIKSRLIMASAPSPRVCVRVCVCGRVSARGTFCDTPYIPAVITPRCLLAAFAANDTMHRTLAPSFPSRRRRRMKAF